MYNMFSCAQPVWPEKQCIWIDILLNCGIYAYIQLSLADILLNNCSFCCISLRKPACIDVGHQNLSRQLQVCSDGHSQQLPWMLCMYLVVCVKALGNGIAFIHCMWQTKLCSAFKTKNLNYTAAGSVSVQLYHVLQSEIGKGKLCLVNGQNSEISARN